MGIGPPRDPRVHAIMNVHAQACNCCTVVTARACWHVGRGLEKPLQIPRNFRPDQQKAIAMYSQRRGTCAATRAPWQVTSSRTAGRRPQRSPPPVQVLKVYRASSMGSPQLPPPVPAVCSRALRSPNISSCGIAACSEDVEPTVAAHYRWTLAHRTQACPEVHDRETDADNAMLPFSRAPPFRTLWHPRSHLGWDALMGDAKNTRSIKSSTSASATPTTGVHSSGRRDHLSRFAQGSQRTCVVPSR